MRYIIGTLIQAGDYPQDQQKISDRPLARAVVVMPRDALASAECMPMFRHVAIVPVEDLEALMKARNENENTHDQA